MVAAPLEGLRRIRIAAGVTQQDAGALIGINKSHYGKFENGKNRLDIYRASTIAKHLGCAIEDFFGESTEQPTEN